MTLPITDVRYHTRALHDQLENCALNRKLMAPDVTQSIYTQWLQGMAGFYQTIDQALQPWRDHEQLGAYLPRVEIEYLQQDKIYWQLSSYNNQEPRVIPDYYQALGLLYVVEGAHFGGRVIHKHIDKHLALTPSTGLALLTYSQQHPKAYWQQLLTLINATQDEPNIQSITQGGCLGFEWAYQCLS